MKRANPTAIVVAMVVSLFGAGGAFAGTITTLTANTQGWVSSSGAQSGSSDYIWAGYCGVATCEFGDDGEYRNYFQFSIPTITGTVVSAKLAISQTAADYTRSFDYSPTLTYAVTSIAGGTVAFDNLGKGTAYGTRDCQESDYSIDVAFTTFYVDLNAEAIQDILASQNSTFWLSGRVESAEVELAAALSSPQPNGWIMAGPLPLQQLIITTEDAPASVPEPTTLFLLAPGAAALVFVRRRGRAVR